MLRDEFVYDAAVCMPSNIAILSDIHGNAPALQAVLEDIGHQHCTHLFMLGDLINGVDPHGCVHLLRTWSDIVGLPVACLSGTAAAYLLTPDRDALPRQDESWNHQVMRLVQWVHDQLTPDDVSWIQSFPDTMRWQETYLVHDSPADRVAVQTKHPDIPPPYREWFSYGRGIRPTMDASEWQELLAFMEGEQVSRLFSGHTHRPFCREVDGKLICNVGSVGAPLDGDPRAAWALVTPHASGQWTCTLRRVSYNVAAQLQRIDQTPDYADFHTPEIRNAYKQWFLTGTYWKAHLPNARW